jgi:hypothetical protein
MAPRLRREPGRTVMAGVLGTRAPARFRGDLHATLTTAVLAAGVPYGAALRLTSWTWLTRIRLQPHAERARRRRGAGGDPVPPSRGRPPPQRGATTSPLRSFGVT